MSHLALLLAMPLIAYELAKERLMALWDAIRWPIMGLGQFIMLNLTGRWR